MQDIREYESRYIPDYEGLYSITSCGKVYSHSRFDSQGHFRKGKFRKPSINNDGYLQVVLRKDGKKANHLIHRLVGKAFIPNKNGFSEINHKDEIKDNNHVSNLEWCSRQYNTEYSQAKYYRFLNPEGKEVEIYNLAKFCKEKRLTPANMYKVLEGTRTHHKGWTKAA